MKIKNKIVLLLLFLLLVGTGFKKLEDFQDFNLSVIVEKHEFVGEKNKELLKGESVTGEFKSKYNKLGIVAVKFDTHQVINDDYVLFRIKEKGSDKWYYSNKYKVDQFQNKKYFPFGFPEIKDSKNKVYQIEIESLNGSDGNSVQVMTKHTPFLSKYSFSKTYLLQNKKEIPFFILNKIRSFFTHITLENYFWILVIPFVFGHFLRLINFSKLLVFLKRFRISTRNSNLFLSKVNHIKWIRTVLIIISLLALFIINWKINGQIKLKALILDDLNIWNFFNTNRNNFFEFIFNTGANKFRPVFLSVFFVLANFFGTNMKLFGLFNLLFSFLVSVVLFFLFRKLSKSFLVSFCLSTAFIISRFAYYNIGQAFGIMETMALLLAILMMYFIWKYFNIERIKYFWISLAIFTLLIFTHERFIILLGLYFILFLFLGYRKRKNILLFFISVLPVALNFVLKMFIFRIRALDGTGGTNIVQTFDFFAFKNFFFSGWKYLLGINAGPAYLNGISQEAVPPNINLLIWIGIACIAVLLMILILLIIRADKNNSKKYIFNSILFFSFIFFNLIAASVTIRLEMRWLYVPLVGLLLLIAYILGLAVRQKILFMIGFLSVIVWIGVLLPREVFYRNFYGNIYFWGPQTFANSLYNATLEKYGDDFWNYKTYIICTKKASPLILSCGDYGDLANFFGQFEGNKNRKNIVLTTDVDKISLDENGKIIAITYDRQQNKFIELNLKNGEFYEIYKK